MIVLFPSAIRSVLVSRVELLYQVSSRLNLLHVCAILSIYSRISQDIKSKGSTQIQGNNVFVITKHLQATVATLDEVEPLPDESHGEFLQGFTKCSSNDFLTVFYNLFN